MSKSLIIKNMIGKTYEFNVEPNIKLLQLKNLIESHTLPRVEKNM